MKKILPAVFAFLFFSCDNSLSKDEFINWLNDENNGYHIRKTSGGFIFDAQYQTPEYLSLISGRTEPAKTEPDDPGFNQFVLTITPDDQELDLLSVGVGSLAEKQQLLYYYAYLFQNDIYLEQGDNHLPCTLFHFERQVDLKKGRTFVLGFEGKPLEDISSKLVISSPYLGSLPVKLTFSIKDIPTLAL